MKLLTLILLATTFLCSGTDLNPNPHEELEPHTIPKWAQTRPAERAILYYTVAFITLAPFSTLFLYSQQ